MSETVLIAGLQVVFGIAVLVALCWLASRRQVFYDEFQSRRQPRIQSNDPPVWVHWSVEYKPKDEEKGDEDNE